MKIEQKQLASDGYLLIKNFFPQSIIDSLIISITNVIEGIIESAQLDRHLYFENYDEIDEVLVRLISNHPRLQPIIYDRLQQMPSLLAVPGSTIITDLASEILSSRMIGVWPRTQIRMDLPGDYDNVINWHNDYIYNKGTVDSYTFWFPLVTMNSQVGWLEFAKGSHLASSGIKYRLLGAGQKFKIQLPDKELAKFDIVTPKPSVGDLVIFHSETWHTGKLNRSKIKARLSGLFRIQNLLSLEI